jgi:hypothetical protein
VELRENVTDDTNSFSAGLDFWLRLFKPWASNVDTLDAAKLDCDELEAVDFAKFEDGESGPWPKALISGAEFAIIVLDCEKPDNVKTTEFDSGETIP